MNPKYLYRSAIIFLLSISFTSRAFATCEVTEIGSNSFSIRTHKNTVTVLGWTHITDESSDRITRGLRNELSSNVSCSQIESNLKALISSHQSDFDHYKRMQDNLTLLAQRDSTARIGVEQTLPQLKRHQMGIQNFRALLIPLVQRCGAVITDELNAITSVLYGPDHQVANNLNRQVVAVESEEIKKNNYDDFEVPETFDYENTRITEDGKNAISIIRSSILSLNIPHESVINRVVAYEANQGRRNELKKNLYLSINRWIEIMRGVYERNTFIAQQLLKSESPIILPIGYLHVDDLRLQLNQLCHQGTIDSSDSYGSQVEVQR